MPSGAVLFALVVVDSESVDGSESTVSLAIMPLRPCDKVDLMKQVPGWLAGWLAGDYVTRLALLMFTFSTD